MKRPLDQLQALKRELNVNIFYTGDIFHTWNQPPELLTFAMKNLPVGYSVPGQHDLPHHLYSDKHKSAYGVLSESGILIDVGIAKKVRIKNQNGTELNLYGLPWGYVNYCCASEEEPVDRRLNVLIGHVYAWRDGNTYPGADRTTNVTQLCKWFETHWPFISTIGFGDNHSGFYHESVAVTQPGIFVNGKFMVRKSDETVTAPQVGIIYADGHVRPYSLDTKEDKYLTDNNYEDFPADKRKELEDFAAVLEHVSSSRVDFRRSLVRYCEANKLHSRTRELILKLADGDDYA